MPVVLKKSIVLGLGLIVSVLGIQGDRVFAQSSQDSKAPTDLAFWEELAFWETIKNSQDIAEFDAYLATYPDGRFARLAEIRIRTLKGASAAVDGTAGAEDTTKMATGDSGEYGSDPSSIGDDATPARGEGGAAGDRDPALRRRGETFVDCEGCPMMVVVPGGKYSMGSDRDRPDEKPRHEVSFQGNFAIGVHEVTIREWAACVRGGACVYDPEPTDNDQLPVGNVSWDDAGQYVAWLSEQADADYRLPSEAEWEYAASGGATTRFWWGNEPGLGRANCKGCGGEWDGQSAAPVGSFEPNPFGLYDVHGNLWEWTLDCHNRSYKGAPSDGSAWLKGDCLARVLRGGSWNLGPDYMPTTRRNHYDRDVRYYVHGFRVLRHLD